MSKRTLAYLALLTTAAIWGVAGPVIKATLQDVPPLTFLTLRFLINTVVIAPVFLLYLRKHPLNLADIPKLFLLTLLGTTVTLVLVFWGFDRTTAIDATLIGATGPLFIVAGGAIFLKEVVTTREKIGVAVALLGILTTVIQPLFEGTAFATQNIEGNLLIVASNISWVAFTLAGKEDFKKHSPFLITATSFIFGFFTFVPFAFAESANPVSLALNLPSSAWLGILYMSLLSSAVAFFAYTWGVEQIEASEAAVFTYLQPLFAAPVAYLWLGEAITPAFLLSAAVIAAGVAITEIRPVSHRRKIASFRHR
jgi:drug/metabolite transporter (DMT)-like permease